MAHERRRGLHREAPADATAAVDPVHGRVFVDVAQHVNELSVRPSVTANSVAPGAPKMWIDSTPTAPATLRQ
jgi:hypothetical protein